MTVEVAVTAEFVVVATDAAGTLADAPALACPPERGRAGVEEAWIGVEGEVEVADVDATGDEVASGAEEDAEAEDCG